MIVCGLKLTHDGTIALVEDNKLIFSVEIEKINNNPRFSEVKDVGEIEIILSLFDYDLRSVDRFVVDGWEGDYGNAVSVNVDGKPNILNVARYSSSTVRDDILEHHNFRAKLFRGVDYEYSSYTHVAGHVVGTWAASPFAAHGENSLVLMWDGGSFPVLFYVDVLRRKVVTVGKLFNFSGHIYTVMAERSGAFPRQTSSQSSALDTAGKVMAYIALGRCVDELFNIFEKTYQNHYLNDVDYVETVYQSISRSQFEAPDILKTFHCFVEDLLVKNIRRVLRSRIRQHNGINLCITGGCALNIKWNSVIRATGEFKSVWVPPFPNDSGSAIGAACCELFKTEGFDYLNWDVYSGPELIRNEPTQGWSKQIVSLKGLAQFLYESNEAVILLNGRAEIGPRALGNRSIIASPLQLSVRDKLNAMKQREEYRPIAPICLEQRASQIFSPGGRDPFMVFDHDVRESWKNRIPAVVHLDGSARLQTVSHADNNLLAELLREFEVLSGVPVLCNTSANLKGRGFFPDVYSASMWSEAKYIWTDGILYYRDSLRTEEPWYEQVLSAIT